MPIGDFVNNIPSWGFLLIHIVLFIIGAYFAWRSFGANQGSLGWAFSLYALAEIVYMTYHLNWTVFLFAHTIAEVLDVVAFIIIFATVARTMLSTSRAAA